MYVNYSMKKKILSKISAFAFLRYFYKKIEISIHNNSYNNYIDANLGTE